jgi:phosphatidylserine decarboxylase
MDRAGLPFVALAAVPALIAGAAGASVVAVVFLALPIAIGLFFRDPDRSPPTGGELVLSPADGRVMFAGEAKADEAPTGRWRQVTIFLSLLDVHVNRSPVAGRVTRIEYRPGTFLPAYRAEAKGNERSEIWIDHDGETIVLRQVVGVLARRVVCRLSQGDQVAAGGRIGLMKFGSRMDVFVPVTATLAVRSGDSVRAGETVIARLSATKGPR